MLNVKKSANQVNDKVIKPEEIANKTDESNAINTSKNVLSINDKGLKLTENLTLLNRINPEDTTTGTLMSYIGIPKLYNDDYYRSHSLYYFAFKGNMNSFLSKLLQGNKELVKKLAIHNNIAEGRTLGLLDSIALAIFFEIDNIPFYLGQPATLCFKKDLLALSNDVKLSQAGFLFRVTKSNKNEQTLILKKAIKAFYDLGFDFNVYCWSGVMPLCDAYLPSDGKRFSNSDSDKILNSLPSYLNAKALNHYKLKHNLAFDNYAIELHKSLCEGNYKVFLETLKPNVKISIKKLNVKEGNLESIDGIKQGGNNKTIKTNMSIDAFDLF